MYLCPPFSIGMSGVGETGASGQELCWSRTN